MARHRPPVPIMGRPSIPEAVRAFEHAGWQKAASEYDATFARERHHSSRHCSMPLTCGSGTRVLDLGCGPGIVTREPRRRGAGADRARLLRRDAGRGAGGLSAICVSMRAMPRRCPIADSSFDAVGIEFRHPPYPASRPCARGGVAACCGRAGLRLHHLGRCRPKTLPGDCCSTRSARMAIPVRRRRRRRAAVSAQIDAVLALLRDAGFAEAAPSRCDANGVSPTPAT